MPSPIAHATMGYVIYRVWEGWGRRECWGKIGPVPALLWVTVGLSLLPDVDAVFGVLMGDLGRFHNHAMNTPVFGLLVALGAGAVVWLRHQDGFGNWFIVTLICYELHVIMDFFTDGRGVMVFWPISSHRYRSPVNLFYGLHWSEGWISVKHLWTFTTELTFVASVGVVMHMISKRRS